MLPDEQNKITDQFGVRPVQGTHSLRGTGPLKRTMPLPTLGTAEALDRLSRLYDIVRSLNSINQLDTLLNQIVASAADMLGARGGALFLAVEGGKLLCEVTSGRVAASFKGMHMTLDESTPEGRVALRNKAAIENRQVGGLLGKGEEPGAEAHKALFVPLTTQGRLVGVLEVIDKVSGADFTKGDLKLLEALADAAVVALENVRLFEEERRQAQRVTEAYRELRRSYQATLQALTGMLDTRDVATHGHSMRVVAFALRLARAMGINDPVRLRIMEQGALLHDVGKIGVADAILRKPGPLTEADWEEMKAHPELGYNMLKGIEFLKEALPIVRYHHEWWDGNGYPHQLKGEQIPLGARIFAVADAFDAITSERPYSRARSYDEVVQILCEESGARFDPQVVSAFMAIPAEEWEAIRRRVGASGPIAPGA